MGLEDIEIKSFIQETLLLYIIGYFNYKKIQIILHFHTWIYLYNMNVCMCVCVCGCGVCRCIEWNFKQRICVNHDSEYQAVF